jgi:hypothetical protein
MSELRVTFSNGVTLTFVQACALGRRLDELLPHAHWHLNDCGCCLTVHGRDCAYVIDSEGGEDCYPGRGCQCPPEDDEPGPIPGESPDPGWMNE